MLNNVLLNNQWVTDKIKDKRKKKYLETNENKYISSQDSWDIANQS